jgi:hypothetical protein
MPSIPLGCQSQEVGYGGKQKEIAHDLVKCLDDLVLAVLNF